MEIKEVNAIVSKFGYAAQKPTPSQWTGFMQDMHEDDKFEAGQTWRKDWLAEMEATFSASTCLHAIGSDDHDGVAMFGLTAINARLAQIWLLQSKEFARGARGHHGAAWTHKGKRMVTEVVTAAQRSHHTVFNFIPKSRRLNIRLLKAGGFTFYDNDSCYQSMHFFAAGPDGPAMAQDPRVWRAFLGEEDVPPKM